MVSKVHKYMKLIKLCIKYANCILYSVYLNNIVRNKPVLRNNFLNFTFHPKFKLMVALWSNCFVNLASNYRTVGFNPFNMVPGFRKQMGNIPGESSI